MVAGVGRGALPTRPALSSLPTDRRLRTAVFLASRASCGTRGATPEGFVIKAVQAFAERCTARGIRSMDAAVKSGSRAGRVEDFRLIRGEGRYADDVRTPDQLIGVFVRSPYAHAKILSIDVTEARAAPGVVDVITAAEMERGGRDEDDRPRPAAGAGRKEGRGAAARAAGERTRHVCRRPRGDGGGGEPRRGRGCGRARHDRVRGAALRHRYGGGARSRLRRCSGTRRRRTSRSTGSRRT